jgi:hypothetical protein
MLIFNLAFILCWTICRWFMKQVSAIYVHIIVTADYVSCIGCYDFFFLCQPVMFSEVSILWFKCLVEFACLQSQLAISLLRSIIVWSLLSAALWGWFLGNMLQWLRSHHSTVFPDSVHPPSGLVPAIWNSLCVFMKLIMSGDIDSTFKRLGEWYPQVIKVHCTVL